MGWMAFWYVQGKEVEETFIMIIVCEVRMTLNVYIFKCDPLSQ